ncbi:MAG: hypothetical protein HQL67_11920 [Magnetococcales bacterium]|nr:hypothetical protein [Magnetococcales bacterium]
MTEHTEIASYDIHDPALLNNMMLSVSIKHPETSVVLITRRTPLTLKVIKQLESRGIETIQAEPIAGETLNEAVEDVSKMFNLVEDIISVKGQSIQSAAALFQEMGEVKKLRGMVKNRMKEIFHLFNPRAADAMIELNNHHPSSAHHSIITGFNVMGIAKELGWNEKKTLQAVMAAMQHDIGKIKVPLDTLDWPGQLDKKRWGEIQLHALFGGRLLYEGELDLPVMVALSHHEWYSTVPGKGYGGLSLFRNYLRKGMDIDISAYLGQAKPGELEVLQISAMADMVSALEEIRSYKGALAPFKVLVIMNSDAKMGHFNPTLYRAWHTVYTKKNPQLLPVGLRVALPREKEQKMFQPGPPRKFTSPAEILSFAEMSLLGVIPRLISRGLDVDQIRRRGGLVLERLRKVDPENGSLGRLITPKALADNQIDPVKLSLPRERQLIYLDAYVRRLSFADLKRMELIYELEQKRFDMGVIQEEDGILISRMEKRGIVIKESKMQNLDIDPVSFIQVKLPAYEDRLTLADLIELGFEPEALKRMGLYQYVEKSRNGASISLLRRKGLQITSQELAHAQINPEKKIFYDIIVVNRISSVRAEFAIVREGDELEVLEKGFIANTLDPIQKYLYESVGIVDLDFSDLLNIPEELDEITMGEHWF